MRLRQRRSGRGPEVGYHDLLDDLEHPGCPVCRGARRAARKELKSLLWEYVNDSDVRRKLRRRHGFCREHTFVALEEASNQAADLGVAILYEDFLGHLLGDAQEAMKRSERGFLRRRFSLSLEALQPQGDCVGCESEDRVAHNYLAIFLNHEADSEVGKAIRGPKRFLCLPHLAQGLEQANGGNDASRLMDIFRSTSDQARGELQRLIENKDYRRADEPKGREMHSWIWAPQITVGLSRASQPSRFDP